MLRYYWRLKKTWPKITGYQKNDLEASNDSSYYYGYFDDLTHWELANGKVQNYFYDLHDQLVKAEFFKKDGSKETWVYSYNALGRRIGKGHLKNEEVSDGLEEETGFVWVGRYIYIYTDPDNYELLAQVRDWTTEDEKGVQQATTSTAIKSAFRVRWLIAKANWFGSGIITAGANWRTKPTHPELLTNPSDCKTSLSALVCSYCQNGEKS